MLLSYVFQVGKYTSLVPWIWIRHGAVPSTQNQPNQPTPERFEPWNCLLGNVAVLPRISEPGVIASSILVWPKWRWWWRCMALNFPEIREVHSPVEVGSEHVSILFVGMGFWVFYIPSGDFFHQQYDRNGRNEYLHLWKLMASWKNYLTLSSIVMFLVFGGVVKIHIHCSKMLENKSGTGK